MKEAKCNILTIAPYNITPVKSGGQAAIVSLHHAIGTLCNDHIAGSKSNGNHDYSFITHKFFSNSPTKYIPYKNISRLIQLAKDNNTTHIICEHPYMAIDAMTIAKKLHIPWYIRSHNIESERFRALGKPWWWILKRYEQFAMRKSNGVFFITPEDAKWAITHFKLPPQKCYNIPFGTSKKGIPFDDINAKTLLSQKLHIDKNVPWLYFLGALNYAPNSEAVGYILDEILPKLGNTKYQILIAGKGLPETLQQKIAQSNQIHYLGFVDNLDQFLNACDIMLNPVLKGGGIKTKAVEALAYNNTVVSTASGSAGLQIKACGEKLLIAADNDWEDFTNKVRSAVSLKANTPNSFYDIYYNGNIAKKVVTILEQNAKSFFID